MLQSSDPMALFRLKAVRAARVSEISETTAAAPVSEEDRISFHIGNPLQDASLRSAFLRLVLGLDIHRVELNDAVPDQLLDSLGWEAADKPKLEFLIRAIQKSAPYMPRGGYSTNTPHALVKTFYAWLDHQQESLHYDNGERSGRREVILASGGMQETLRVVLFTLSRRLAHLPARILCYDYDLPPSSKAIPNLQFEDLSADEQLAYDRIVEILSGQPQRPTFLILGSVPDEMMRHKLRKLSTECPLFFIEANNAPNHLSLAREAKLVQVVIRLLTPVVFSPELHTLSTVFIAGNADFLRAIESVHFNLKGTPSASEIELLTFLLDQQLVKSTENLHPVIHHSPSSDRLVLGNVTFTALPHLVEQAEHHAEELLSTHTKMVERSLKTLEDKADLVTQLIQNAWKTRLIDEFAGIEVRELLDLLIDNLDRMETIQALEHSFLSSFVKHQPQYQPESCVVVSGSSRTALGILGFHCGITEAVIPDLSWSYEQCFPQIHVVPLTESLELDAGAIIEKVEELCRRDPSWRKRGAVVINNPHNATGRIFDEETVKKLVIYCLENDIYFIDDLAYQNMVPADDLPEIKTLRQLTEELVWLGLVDEQRADRVVTVHTVSKTDCLAGSRLAVVEIRDQSLRQRFEAVNRHIQPNVAAILLSYLFYRNTVHTVRTYWHLRNALLGERSQALLTALDNLPGERNPFGLEIIPPAGSMYPLLHVKALPAGLSLDWLSSSLARRGIGMLPLATFARTEKGFETGRTTFRLTLGGSDDAKTKMAKTRRLLIDFNRLIDNENARYNRKKLALRASATTDNKRTSELTQAMDVIAGQILEQCLHSRACRRLVSLTSLDVETEHRNFMQWYAPERLEVFRTRLLERAFIHDELVRQTLDDGGNHLAEKLQREFMKDSLQRRQELFKRRSYDRTVHPTQMYSLDVELAFDAILNRLIAQQPVAPALIERTGRELLKEYFGLNVTISSQQEANEILLDMNALTASEQYTELFSNTRLTPFLSFWSDWDGSNRPSGQGHYLAAALVMENVRRMAHILNILRRVDPSITVSPDLVSELDQLDQRNQRFQQLLTDITQLTHQLEQRYRGILPFSLDTTPLQRMATRLHLRRDPAKTLWLHNDHYEQKMLELRQERRQMLEYYFALNKQLRKQLYALIPNIQMHRTAEPLLNEVVNYQDTLQRVVITPRIQESMITARDSFAVDTTVYNVHEINTISGKYGNPGMVLAMQISLSTQPDTLITLDRKMHTQLEQARREHPSSDQPSIWLIPLFEHRDSVSNIHEYLNQMWDYATQSRHTSQSTQNRFSEIITEVFIAGSDLSQQVSQATSAYLYKNFKHDVLSWLVEHETFEPVRIKLGSGEPMQRQGGYYSPIAGEKAFLDTAANQRRFSKHLTPAARKSTAYAVTPLQGVFLGGELRTFQSNLSEQLRYLPVSDFAGLLYHVRETQYAHREDLIRAVETAGDSRLLAPNRSLQELERLTIGTKEVLYEQFLEELTDGFRHILYGKEEDVVGIHIISYFIGRSMPQLRDRPTSRRTGGTESERGQRILSNIAEIVPLAKQGSLLRAISHNKAQTAILGVNQLTTGLFRALERLAQKTFVEAEQERMIAERLLPHLPMYEILRTLRIYQDQSGEILQYVETAFPAGNSAFVALREDCDAMQRYLPLFQQELLRRHGVNVHEFFNNGVFIPELLPTLRPDLAVLLQEDLFNTELDVMLERVSGKIDEDWLAEVTQLLQVPRQIHHWRSIIWDEFGQSIFERVQSFVELATTLYAYASTQPSSVTPMTARGTKLSPALAQFFRTARAEDEMRGFLIGAIEYLSIFAEDHHEMPVSIIRAMNGVERIAHIEESILPPEKQSLFRHCMLQIARLANENG